MMTEQQRRRECGSAPDDAGRETVWVLGLDAERGGLCSRPVITDLDHSAPEGPRLTGAQEAEGRGRARSFFIRPHRSGAAVGFWGGVHTGGWAGQGSPVCINTSRGRFFALVAGPETSSLPLVLMLHGFMGGAGDFCPIFSYLADAGYRVVAVD